MFPADRAVIVKAHLVNLRSHFGVAVELIQEAAGTTASLQVSANDNDILAVAKVGIKNIVISADPKWQDQFPKLPKVHIFVS